VFAPTLLAEEPTDQVARLEKAGATVTVDDSLPEAARLRVTFGKLDDKGAAALQKATQIATLTVEDASKLTDRSMALIGRLTNLRELSLFQAGITNAGMAHLKGLKELRKLYLVEATKVFDSGVASLKGHAKLEELDLSETSITNLAAATFKTFPALKLLAVNKTKFGDAGAAQLKDLKELKRLEAVNTELSVKGAMTLESALPKIRILR
jgi:hypothetical protein